MPMGSENRFLACLCAPLLAARLTVECCMCCRRSNGFSAQVTKQIQAKLKEIDSVFPNTTIACVITQSGHLIAQQVKNYTERIDELVVPIASLKRAAENFGLALNQSSCPVIHIQGNNVMFSCYELGDNLLAFYTNMSESDKNFDTTEADSKMSQIITELRLLFQNMII